MNFSAIDFSILAPALLTGLLVTTTHVPLGQRVLKRGIIFLDLAVAQIAGLGIIIASSFHWSPGGWQVQLIAITAAILGVMLLNFTERHWPDIQEALIGSLFVLASSASILLLTGNAHSAEQLKDLLVGQILWVSYEQLLPVFILYLFVLGLWFKAPNSRSSLKFYILFALSITASVQLVGVYLVFASLILPALAIRHLEKNSLKTGYIISGLAYFLGLLIAALFDLPAGPVIVFSLAILALFTAVIIKQTRQKGN